MNNMISLLTLNFNNNSIQSDYDRLLNDKLLVCPNCGSHHLKYHGSYIRNFSLFSEYHLISIRRYRCTKCHVTHAIFLYILFPIIVIIISSKTSIINWIIGLDAYWLLVLCLNVSFLMVSHEAHFFSFFSCNNWFIS